MKVEYQLWCASTILVSLSIIIIILTTDTTKQPIISARNAMASPCITSVGNLTTSSPTVLSSNYAQPTLFSSDYTQTTLTESQRLRNDKLEKQPWTSVNGKGEKDSYHFFSAYYDDRKTDGRPAVIVMGYVYGKVKKVKLYCSFTYNDGRKVCRKTPTTDKHPSCFAPKHTAKPQHHFCAMKPGEEPPEFVQLSTSSSCDHLSGEIPVQNYVHQKPSKRFGVCVGGPLVQESDSILNDIVQFINMSRRLGAELIVFYVNEAQIDQTILEHIWTHYPDTVRTIGWKKFSKWEPMHYYGQILMNSDCHYRLMYQVEYLVQIDIDEMILPVKHRSWNEMVKSFPHQSDISTYKFQNAFFVDPKPSKNENSNKYLTRTKRYKCFPGYQYRTKLIFLPRFIVESSIHYKCKSIAHHEKTFNVPPEVAILGHYRSSVPNDCKRKPTFIDKTASKLLK